MQQRGASIVIAAGVITILIVAGLRAAILAVADLALRTAALAVISAAYRATRAS